MKSINNLILRALTATLLIGCGNESYKETIQNIPKKNKDLYTQLSHIDSSK